MVLVISITMSKEIGTRNGCMDVALTGLLKIISSELCRWVTAEQHNTEIRVSSMYHYERFLSYVSRPTVQFTLGKYEFWTSPNI